jgi:hypothetical protein
MYEEMVGFKTETVSKTCAVTITSGKASAPYREHWHVYY